MGNGSVFKGCPLVDYQFQQQNNSFLKFLCSSEIKERTPTVAGGEDMGEYNYWVPKWVYDFQTLVVVLFSVGEIEEH
ncbi:hypothetical protein KL86SPO_50234 [uncultured Sporomusa sp.]|uniref:Uncharacterized protein n=1 Tax=uncultured Sporomusa sp. TaxID=307249 RepID=A0A212LXZ0_9FIRM|nr:hypothetical protein [uncultured Sporomusa sp.]SCM82463.1 hypothetical protein KL86SPO_50234 [uncultured Sporomusa sp.]